MVKVVFDFCNQKKFGSFSKKLPLRHNIVTHEKNKMREQ